MPDMVPLNFCSFTEGGVSSLLTLSFAFNLANISIFSHFTFIYQPNGGFYLRTQKKAEKLTGFDFVLFSLVL